MTESVKRSPPQVELDADDLSVIESCSIEKLEKLEIFKTNPKFYTRLKLVTDTDSFYEAQQMYKTIHFRCNVHSLVQDSIKLLFNGIIYFLRKNSILCGYDLAKSFVDALKTAKNLKLDNDLRSKIRIIHKLLKPSSEERNEFSIAILKWSGNLFEKSRDMKDVESVYNNYQKTFGHFDIHQDFANNLWKEKNYVQARYHFLHSMDARSFSQMTIECHLNFGYPSEFDLFMAQNVLLYLTLRNLRAAEEFFLHYVSSHPSVVKTKLDNNDLSAKIVLESYESPIVNFIHFLIITLKSHSYKTYQALLDAYRPILQRDTSLYAYLEKVSEHFYNVKKPNSGKPGLFSNLMKMLTSNETSSGGNNVESNNEDEESSDEEETGHRRGGHRAHKIYTHDDDDALD